MAEKIEEWEAITPGTLIAPIKHVRSTFDEGMWKCSHLTEKLCFGDLHLDDKQDDLGPYESAFVQYRTIVGPAAAQQFDRDRRVGTPPAIFHAFLQILVAGIRAEMRRVFADVLKIGIAHSGELSEHPVEWAKRHITILIKGNKHRVVLWIKSVCDRRNFAKPPEGEQEFANFISWKDWRAPKLIYMRPSGNLPYDALAAWNREDGPKTDELLDGISDRVIQSLDFGLDRLVGDAHVELAKVGDGGLEGNDRRFAMMAIEEALKSVPEDDRPHPKVGAVVVKNCNVLSRAHRGENPKSHAEYIALEDKLPDDLVAGATVYTTLEPCTTRSHPKIPCAQRLVDRKVARVVIGMLDPNPDIRGLGVQLLNDAGIETQLFQRGLAAQVEEMNREFIRAQKQKGATAKAVHQREAIRRKLAVGRIHGLHPQLTIWMANHSDFNVSVKAVSLWHGQDGQKRLSRAMLSEGRKSVEVGHNTDGTAIAFVTDEDAVLKLQNLGMVDRHLPTWSFSEDVDIEVRVEYEALDVEDEYRETVRVRVHGNRTIESL